MPVSATRMLHRGCGQPVWGRPCITRQVPAGLRPVSAMIVMTGEPDVRPPAGRNPGLLSAASPESSWRASPSPPSAPSASSIPSSPRSAGRNGINVETFGYVDDLGDRSTHKSPRSPNPPHYPAHRDHQHPPSHQAGPASELPSLTGNQSGRTPVRRPSTMPDDHQPAPSSASAPGRAPDRRKPPCHQTSRQREAARRQREAARRAPQRSAPHRTAPHRTTRQTQPRQPTSHNDLAQPDASRLTGQTH
jgi:hypothetical protein